MLRDLIQDLRYGIRILIKNPGFTIVAVLTLALGIGANTALFSIVNSVLLRPFQFPESERLVMIYETNLGKGWDRFTVAPANYIDWKDRTRCFDHIAAFTGGNYVLTGGETPERVRGARVSQDLFPMLGIAPEIGRALIASDDGPGAPRVAVISHQLYAERFGSDPRILERTLTLDGLSYAIVGVMPERFKFLDARFWIPTAWDAARRSARGNHQVLVMGRLAPGTSTETARAELDRLSVQLAKDYPDTNSGWGVLVSPLYQEVVGGAQRTILILFGATAFVLLAAGANVANLLLARASARSKEVAIRNALGAGRGRMIRQLLAETVLLTSIGGGAGVLVALWGLDLFRLLPGLRLPRSSEIGIDGRVLLFSLCVSVGMGLLFGLVPALRSSRSDLHATLKEGGSSGGSLGRDRFRSLLVVLETSLALVLLIGAGLLIRSLWRLQEVDPGFHTENILTWTVSLPQASYGTEERRALFFESLLEKVKTLPGVRSTAAVSNLPIGGGDTILAFYVEGRPPASPGDVPSANFYAVSAEYLATMGIPLLAGRSFTKADTANAPPVMLVNATMASKHFGGHPIGQRIRVGGPDSTPVEIVGVVGDVKHYGLSSETTAQMYEPLPQQPLSAMTFALRGTGDPTSLTAAVRHEVSALDPSLPIFDIKTMTTVLDTSLAFQRSSATLLLTFAALAMALASIGIYGVISYSVTQRTREIGVRMALGAARGDVLRLVVGQGLKLTLAGLAIGLVAAFALTRVLTRLLFGVGPLDPITFAAIPVILALVALAACYLPARRAARVDPMKALRCE